MFGRGQGGPTAYRGPERRGADRIPPSPAAEDPARRFWTRAAAVAPLVGVFVLAVAAVTAEGFDEIPTVHAALRLCSCLILLGSGVGLYLRWRLTGEAPLGLLGAALVVWALPALPFALADVALDPEATLRRLGPMTRMTVTVPAAWLLLRSLRAPEVESDLRPVREALGYSAAATLAAGALTGGQALGLVAPSSPLALFFTESLLGSVLVAFAAGFARGGHAIPRPVAGRVAFAFAGLGVANLLGVIARLTSPPVSVLAQFVAVVSATVLLLVAASLLRSAVDFYGLRMLSLRLEADSAEDAVRREQERMHELRATVAGIRQASGTLHRYADRLDPDREHDLREMMAAELNRLERLLGADWHAPHAGPVMLDEVIRPLVVCQREQGVTVTWRPSGVCAVTDGDAVAEIVSILLTNARVHAQGAVVEIQVEERPGAARILVADDGPGVPAELRESLFERGVRHARSPGSGLGLHIARDLARECGGELELLPTDAGRTCFAVTIPAPSDPRADRPDGLRPLQESG